MIRLLKCELMKIRRCYIFLTALAMTALAAAWSVHGNYGADQIRLGWRMFLYQLPLVNTIFLPFMATITASRLCSIEHKGAMLKQLCAVEKRRKLYDAKLIFGLAIMILAVLIMWCTAVLFGMYKGFAGGCPFDLYLLYLLFTIVPTIEIYIFQHTLSLVFKNQAVSFFTGIIGEFAGLFSMFLPQLPWLRQSLLWGHYGALQFMGMFGWAKETRYANVHFDIMPIDRTFFAALIAVIFIMYFIGRHWFIKKEI